MISETFLERNLRKISRETFHIRRKSQLGCSSEFFTPEEDGSDIILGQSRHGTKSAAALSAPISIRRDQRITIVGYDRSRTGNRKQSDKGTVKSEWWMKFFGMSVGFCAGSEVHSNTHPRQSKWKNIVRCQVSRDNSICHALWSCDTPTRRVRAFTAKCYIRLFKIRKEIFCVSTPFRMYVSTRIVPIFKFTVGSKCNKLWYGHYMKKGRKEHSYFSDVISRCNIKKLQRST